MIKFKKSEVKNLDITTLIIAMSIPSAITGFCFWLVEHNIQKREKANKEERDERQRLADEREVAREKNELCLIRCVGAALALGEATAKAVQRIPDAHCNGDMHEALEYAKKVKHEQKDFLTEQSVKGIY
jgi:hypothetical protein